MEEKRKDRKKRNRMYESRKETKQQQKRIVQEIEIKNGEQATNGREEESKNKEIE